MADEIDMLEDAEFENQISAMGDNQLELTKFVARQQFTTSKVLVSHGKRIKKLEKQNRKMMGIIGSAGAIFGTAITATIDYMLKRQ